jgi:folate-binding protein YgfZ
MACRASAVGLRNAHSDCKKKPMPLVALPDRSIVSVAGPDAEHLLQNVITTDLDALAVGQAKPGALLTPQGKILFDFLISRNGSNGFRLDTRRDAAGDLAKRLVLYRLRAKAEIAVDDQTLVAAAWGNDSGASENDSSGLADTRFREDAVLRIYDKPTEGSIRDWQALRIRNAVAESGSDYALSDAFPHDVLLDQMEGVGMRKGCYVGQEVVSRMQHRGTARRRVLIADAETTLPAAASEITANGKSLGTLGSTEGRRGLAIVRIDRVKEAIDSGAAILAGGTPVTLSIPSWANFRFPEGPEAEPT